MIKIKWRVFSNGHIKYQNSRGKRYYSFLRYKGNPRWSARGFRTASLADEYGDRLAERYNRLAEVQG